MAQRLPAHGPARGIRLIKWTPSERQDVPTGFTVLTWVRLVVLERAKGGAEMDVRTVEEVRKRLRSAAGTGSTRDFPAAGQAIGRRCQPSCRAKR